MGLHPKNDQIAASPISTEICFTEWLLGVGHLNPSKLKCTLSSLHLPRSNQMKCTLSAMQAQFSTTHVQYIEGSISNIFWQCNKKLLWKKATPILLLQCNAKQSKAKQSKTKQICYVSATKTRNEQKSYMKKTSNKSRLLLAADLPIHLISFR